MKPILSIAFLSIVLSCTAIRYSRDSLTMKRQDYNGNALKLNGVYLRKTNRFISSFFLYKNGTFFRGMGIPTTVKNANDIDIKSWTTKELDLVRDIVYWWGLFKIDNTNINIEAWRSDDGLKPYPIQSFQGRILNDTTIVLNSYCTSGLDTFHFYETLLKPDSTNKFIP
jgi:hypothetical protein